MKRIKIGISWLLALALVFSMQLSTVTIQAGESEKTQNDAAVEESEAGSVPTAAADAEENIAQQPETTGADTTPAADTDKQADDIQQPEIETPADTTDQPADTDNDSTEADKNTPTDESTDSDAEEQKNTVDTVDSVKTDTAKDDTFQPTPEIAYKSADGETTPADEGIVAKLSTSDDALAYPTGSEITLYAGIELKGAETELSGGHMRVTVPKEYLDDKYANNEGIHPAEGATSSQLPVVTLDEDNYYLDYSYNDLKGGTTIDLPFTFKTKSVIVADQTTIKLTADLYDGTDQELDHQELTLTNTAELSVPLGEDYTAAIDEPDLREGSPANTASDLNEAPSLSLPVYYRSSITSNPNELGVFQYPKLQMSVKLDPNAHFDAASNPDWTYDESTMTATQIVNAIGSNMKTNVHGTLNLQFPNVPYKTEVKAFTYTLTPIDDSGALLDTLQSPSYQETVKIAPKVINNTTLYHDVVGGSDYMYVDDNMEKETTWTMTTGLEADETTVNATAHVADNMLTLTSAHIYATDIYIDAASSIIDDPQTLAVNKLVGTKLDGTEEVIAENIPLDQVYTLSDQQIAGADSYRKLDLQFPNNVDVKAGQKFIVKVTTKTFDQDWENATADDPSWVITAPNSFLDSAIQVNSQAEYVDEGYKVDNTIEGKSMGVDNFTITQPSAFLNISTDKTDLFVNEFARIKVDQSFSKIPDDQLPDYDLVNAKMVILLPNGWKYVNDEENKTRSSVNGKPDDYDPQIVYDYKGTGQMALIVDYNDFTERPVNKGIAMNFTLQALNGTPKGTSQVEAFITADNLTESGYRMTTVPDELDNDGDQDKTEGVMEDTVSLEFTPSREVVGVTKAGSSLDKLTTGSTSSMDLGDDFYFGYDILNLQESENIRSLDMLGALPRVDDGYLVKGDERGSQYAVTLTGPIQLLKDGALSDASASGYVITYSTELPGDVDAKDGARIDTDLSDRFVAASEITDWSKVTMFKIAMKSGIEIAAQETVSFAAPAKVSDDESIKNGDLSLESFAFAASTGADAQLDGEAYAETAPVTVPISRYTVAGTVFKDKNKDGLMNEGETGMAGTKADLLDNSGKVLESTTTDKDGHYSFDVKERGDYSIKLTAADGEETLLDPAEFQTDPNAKAVKTYQEVEVKANVDKDGKSGAFTLSPSTKDIYWNAALRTNDQQANVVYFDDTQKAWLKTDDLNGKSKTTSDYQTQETIKTYTDKGYELVSDNYPKAGMVFDDDATVNQTYSVHLKHTFSPANETKTVKQTIHYVYADKTTAKPDMTDNVTFTRSGQVDNVTKEATNGEWTAKDNDTAFEVKKSPAITGFTPDKAQIEEVTGLTRESSDSELTVTYTGDTQKATIQYIDDTTKKNMRTDNTSGKSKETSDYKTKSVIDGYKAKCYELVNDGVPSAGIVFDTDTTTDQNYEVHLKHTTTSYTPTDNKDNLELSRTIKQTIHYVYDSGKTAKPDVTDSVSFTHTAVKDNVSGAITYSVWTAKDKDTTFDEKVSPEIKGYTPDQQKVEEVKGLTEEAKDQETTVTYLPDGQVGAVVYFDDTDKVWLSTDTFKGKSDGEADYTTKASIEKYEAKGFDLVKDTYPAKGVTFDKDVNKVQIYSVHLKHTTTSYTPTDNKDNLELSRTVKQTIHYVYEGGKTAKPDVTDSVSFTRTAVKDNVSGIITYSDWAAKDKDTTFEEKVSPKIKGYTPDVKSEAEIKKLTADSKDVEATVTYMKDEKPAAKTPTEKTPIEKTPTVKTPTAVPTTTPTSAPSAAPTETPAAETKAAETRTPETPTAKDSDGKTHTASVDTGDHTSTGVWITVMSSVLILLVIIIKKYHRNRR